MRELTVYLSDVKFTCRVEKGRETVHPESPHRKEDSLLDERVPQYLIISVDSVGRETVLFERPLPLPAAKLTPRSIAATEGDEEDEWILSPGDGEVVAWPEDWVSVSCRSTALLEYCLERLTAGDWETVARKAKIRKLPARILPSRSLH
jgi:hypothetical protein